MTKDVILSISGLQFFGEEDASPVKIITAATYYNKHGKHYLLYDEVLEGFQDITKNIIKLKNDSLDISKKGIANVDMLFEKNKRNITYYNTPYGSFYIGIHASNIKMTETEDDIDVEVDYALEINHEHAADCKIKMNIHSKEAKNFKLL